MGGPISFLPADTEPLLCLISLLDRWDFGADYWLKEGRKVSKAKCVGLLLADFVLEGCVKNRTWFGLFVLNV